MSKFIDCNGLRIKASSIKKYRDVSNLGININFTSIANTYETEAIKFDDESTKNQFLKVLNNQFEGDVFTVNRVSIMLSSIKKYKPLNTSKLVIYYGVSKKNPKSEIFEFENEDTRDEYLLELDVKMGVL